MKVLITGASGFIGSHLVEELCSRADCNITCMMRKNSDTSALPMGKISAALCDLRDCCGLEDIVKEVDIIYHLGGIVRAVDKKQLYRINSCGTENLVNAVIRKAPQLKRFVYVSSQAAWGPQGRGPVSDYGKSKKEGEKAVKSLPSYSIVRPGIVYGPRDKDFLDVFKAAARGIFAKPLGGGRLSFIHVKDCVKHIVESTGREIFAGDGASYSWREVKGILQKTVGKRIVSIPVPGFMLRLMGLAGDAAGRVSGKAAKINSDKIREVLGGDWVMPTPLRQARYGLEEGFRQTWNWYKKNGWIK